RRRLRANHRGSNRHAGELLEPMPLTLTLTPTLTKHINPTTPGLMVTIDRLDVDARILRIGAAHRLGEPRRGVARDLDAGLAREDLDLADRLLRHVAAAAQQRDQPLRIGVLRAADV